MTRVGQPNPPLREIVTTDDPGSASHTFSLGTTRTLRPSQVSGGVEAAPRPESGYVSPAETRGRLDRQDARYTLRAGLRMITTLKRLRECGLPLGPGYVVARVLDGVHHFTGVVTCGSGWACPVCAAKIRFRRADEVARAVTAAIEAGYGALFVTRTIPHGAEDALAATLGLLKEGRRWVTSQRAVKDARKRAGYLGGIAATEITYGRNGWHPHTHDVEVFLGDRPEGGLSDARVAELRQVYWDFLNAFYVKRGHRGLSPEHGVRVDVVTSGSDALGQYLAKLQEGGSVGNELTRADLKKGRIGSLLPFDLAVEFLNTGAADALDLWHEFERETKGKSVIRFTKGLRKKLLPNEEEKTDEELAAEEIGGTAVVRFEDWFFRRIAAVPGLEGKVLRALDEGGFPALVELLTVYHLDAAAKAGLHLFTGLDSPESRSASHRRQAQDDQDD